MKLTLPIPARELSANVRVHHMKKSPITRAHRQRAFFATLEALTGKPQPKRILLKDRAVLGIPPKGKISIKDYHRVSTLISPTPPPIYTGYTLTFYHPTTRGRDDDNAGHSAKAYRDGLADALRIDDSTLRLLQPPTLLIDRNNPRLEITLHP